ncbi:MAG: hypothetical protein HY791_11630 [Deltaproteobacteria bacterium]|nr:hypothetical protein [Deltaproteobacteria bacterium]
MATTVSSAAGRSVWNAGRVLGSLLGCGCSSHWLVQADLPPDTAYIAAIALGANEGSALATIDEATHLELDRGEGSLFVFGWTDQDLEGVPIPGPEVRSTSLLFRSEGSSPGLPVSSFSARKDEGRDEAATIDPLAAPRVGARWQPDCPNLGDRLVDPACLGVACGLSLTQSGCTLTLASTRCVPAQSSGSVDGRGGVHIGPNEAYGTCHSLDDRSDPIVAECDKNATGRRCELRLHDARPAPTFRITRTQRASTGLALGGATRVQDELAVAVYPTVPCRDEPTRIDYLDPASLELVRTSSAPPCSSHLSPRQQGDGFYAMTSSTGRWLERLDENGRSLARARLPFRADGELLVRQIAVSERLVAVYVLPKDPKASPDPSARVYFFEPDSLRLRGELGGFFNDRAGTITFFDGDHLVVADDRNQVSSVDVDTLDITRTESACGVGATGRLIRWDTGSISVNYGESGAIAVRGSGGSCTIYAFWEWPAQPTDAVEVDGLLVVGLDQVPFAGSDVGAALALFDPTLGFLPGATPLGVTRISNLISWGHRVLGILSSGEVFLAERVDSR